MKASNDNSSFNFLCPHCSQSLDAGEELIGVSLDCPGCGKDIVVPAPTITRTPSTPAVAPSFVRPLPQGDLRGTMSSPVITNVKQGAIIGGWVCFALGLICMLLSLFMFFLYGPLFLVAFILSILAMSQKRVLGGIMLLLATLIIPTVLGLVLFSIRTTKFADDLSKSARTETLSESTKADNLNDLEGDSTKTPEIRPNKYKPANIERINDAFGMKLGNIFDPSSAVGKGSLTDGTPMYQFSPANPFRSFTKYYVLITPQTHRIYSIWAIGSVKNTATGKKEQALIMKLLEEKYGASKNQGLLDSIGDTSRISHGSRYVLTKVSGFVDTSIDLRYYDRELEKAAEKERIAIEQGKVDPTGL